ncbi:SRPBCC family protein [Phytoactinopolyspora mesophila]|uniref:Toxin-antitoxin system toxin subunit n=1 Tax=Phytoactinopolyspora mesophila TaxID=2650750 RepID=A0A7K3M7B8_9ACTN|nr:SRPBCC family protein [Phytoactinopolyspora mesophila]NDL58947.1 toxin-antitoxin system toxin subunit [Phytoactinopolyspora mesophila]
MTETLNKNADGRTVLRIERHLSHPPTKVWRALTDPKELSQWFPATATTVDLRAGGTVQLEYGDEMLINTVEPPHVVEFSWHGELLRWELRPDEHGCKLMFTHTFDDHAGAASFASGWQQCLVAMELLLDGKPVEHERPSAELHDAFVETFGLDEGILEQTADGWRVRFERQLTAPAAQAWAVLAPRTPELGDPAPQALSTPSVTAGPVTHVEAPSRLEYQWLLEDRPAGSVRWELSDDRGTGHGARLVIVQTGSTAASGQQSLALEAWQRPIQDLAEKLRQITP